MLGNAGGEVEATVEGTAALGSDGAVGFVAKFAEGFPGTTPGRGGRTAGRASDGADSTVDVAFGAGSVAEAPDVAGSPIGGRGADIGLGASPIIVAFFGDGFGGIPGAAEAASFDGSVTRNVCPHFGQRILSPA